MRLQLIITLLGIRTLSGILLPQSSNEDDSKLFFSLFNKNLWQNIEFRTQDKKLDLDSMMKKMASSRIIDELADMLTEKVMKKLAKKSFSRKDEDDEEYVERIDVHF